MSREDFVKSQKRYLDKYGENSLDRVILIDPLTANETDYLEAAKTLDKSIQSENSLPQVPKNIWKNLVF